MTAFEFHKSQGNCLVAVFPNGGSAGANMGRALCDRFPAALEVYEQAKGICKVPMEGLWRTDSELKAADPALDIVATFVNCVAVNAIRRSMAERLRPPDLVIGSSLGVVAALEAAGACTLAQGLSFLVQGEKRFYEPLKHSLLYGTVNIFDVSRDELNGLIAEDLELSINCCPAYCSLIYHPYHDPTYGAESSNTGTVAALRDRVKAALGRQVGVAVHFPERRLFLHTSLCRSLEREICDFVRGLGMAQPRTPVMSESTVPRPGAGPYVLATVADVVNELARLVSSPSHFAVCIRALVRAAHCRFVEMGPCSSEDLTTASLIRRIVPRASCTCVDSFRPEIVEESLLHAFA